VVTAALFDGAFQPIAYAVGAIAIWTAVLAGLLSRALPSGRIAAPAIVAGLCLAATVVLAGASVAWASDQGRAFEEAVRASAYLGLFALAACTATERARGQWVAGMAVGLTAVSALAVASWLQPGFLDDRGLVELIPTAAGRLSYPIGYWNGLAAMLAVAAVLLAHGGAQAPDRWLRAASVAAMPTVLFGIWLTTSRGAVAAVLLGLVVLIAAGVNRPRRLAVALIGCGGAAAVILAAAGMQSLTDGLTDATARAEGDWASAILVVGTLVCGGAAWLADGWDPRFQLSRRIAVGLALLAAAAIAIAIVVADPVERFREFREPPPASATPLSQLGDQGGSGNGRWQFWGSAVDAFESAPVAGLGAGGYEDWWAQNATITFFARSAHSLPLQQLAELGLLGAGLMLGFLAAVAVAAWRRLAAGRDGDGGVLVAVVAAGGLSAAIDWSWAIPAVFCPVVVAAGLLTASAPGRDEPRRDAYALGLGTAATAWVAMMAAGIVVLTELKLEQSRSAAAEGRVVDAIERAMEARTVQPWSPEPYTQLALLEAARGDLDAGLDRLEQAKERDSEDWRLPLLESRLLFEAGDRVAGQLAFGRARALNPRAIYVGGSG
jgi:hypothetical protein